jgi:hypothetical protein
MDTWESKDPAEEFAVEFDFSSELSTITSATVTVSTLRGTDAAPTDVLNGNPEINGTTVRQRIQAGTHKCTYKFRCEATDGTEVWVITQGLPVLTK